MSFSKIKNLELSIKKKLSGDFLGSYKTAFKGSGIMFHDLREYSFGDSVKHIDWKTSAKYNDLYIKNFEEERDLKVLFLLDITPSMRFGVGEKNKLDLLIEVFFYLAFSAAKNMDNISVLLCNGDSYEYLDFKPGEENIFTSINKIKALLDKSSDTKDLVAKAFKKIDDLKIRNSLIFTLSDKLDYEKTIFKLLGLENEIIYINLYDHFENNLSDEQIGLTLGIKNKFLNLFLGDKDKKEQFIELRKKKISDFEKNLKKLSIDYLYIDTHSDVFRELLKFFKKRTL